MPELPTPDEILNTGGNNLPSPEFILGDEAKKKVPTGPLVGTGALVAAPKKGQSKLDQLLLQGKSFIYTPGSEEDLASEDALENQTKDLLNTRLNNGYKSLISLPETPRSELPQGLKEAALYPETQKQLNKLTKKFELTESESSSFANPLVRLSNKPTSPVPSDLKGVEFWDNEYAAANKPNVNEQTGEVSKKGFQTYPYNREDGLLFDKTTLAPVVLKKIMDDYANFIQKTQPNKYKLLSYLDKGSIPFTEARLLLTDNKKLGEMMTPYIDADRATKAMEEGKDVPVNQMSQVERYNIMMEALNHQSVILNQDYEDMKAEGITDADQKYARGRKALEDLSKNILQSFPDMAKDVEDIRKIQQAKTDKQNAADRFYQSYIDRGGFWADPDLGLRMNLVQPIAQSIQDFASGWLTLPRDIGLANSIPALQEIVKIGDAVGSDENLPELATPLKESVVPQIVKGVSDMSLLLLGTKGLGSALSVGYKPAMFANSFAITHDNYYQEAKDAGMTDSQASEHAARSAALTSALEFISPNKGIVNGFKASITPSVVKMLSKGATIKDAFNAGAKDLLKEVGAENAQEITQLIGNKASNYYTNQLLGKSSLDTKIRTDEILNTILVTSAVTGLVAAPMVRNKSSLQRDFMYTAATNPDLTETAINSAIETERIDKKSAEILRKKLTDYKPVIDGLPANLPGATKSKLADLVYQKKLLEEQKKDTYVDPVFKNVKEAEQLQAEQEIDNEINTTINDTQKQIGLPSVLGVRETNVQARDVQETSGKEIETNQILQAQEPSIDESRPDEAMDAYVNRMVEEHKTEGDVVGPVETEFATQFYTKKWMDKFGSKTKPIEQPIVLTEQQIERTHYGENEAANAFEGRTQNDVNESEAAIQALESEAKDVERSQDRARAAQVYGAAGELIDQSITDSRTKNGYTVQNKGGVLNVINTEGQPVKSKKVRQSVLRNYKKTLRVFNDSGTLRVVDETGTEVMGPEFTDNLIQKYKETFPYDQGRTSVEVAETGDPVELSENPMELAAIGTPEAAVKFKQLTGVDIEEYNAPKISAEQKTLRDRFNKSIDEVIRSLDKNVSSFIVPPQVIKAALRTVKAAVNAGFTVEEALRKGVETIRKSQWFKSAGNPEEAVESFTTTVGEVKRKAESGEEIQETPKKDIKAINTAKKGRKQIAKKIRAKQKGATSVFANDRNTLKEFIKLDPREVSDIDEYNNMVGRIKESLNNPIIRSDGSIKRGGRVISNAEISQYIDKEQKFIKQNRDAKARAEYEMLLTEGMDLDAILSGEIEESMLKPDTKEQKRQAIKSLVDKKLSALTAFVKLKDEEGSVYENWTPEEKKLWDTLSTIDTADMSITDLVSLNNVLENVATNESLDGAGKLAMLAESQRIVPEVTKLFEDIDPGKITKGAGQVRNVAYSLPLMTERITFNSKKAAELNRLMGLQELFAENTAIDKRMEKLTQEVNDMKRTMKDPDSLKNRFTRGIYAFLIRNKGGDITDIETEFTRKKSIIEDQIKTLSAATDTALQEQAKLLQEIYDDLGVKDATTYEDLKIDSDNKRIVDKFKEESTAFRDELDEHSRLFNNQGITPENNYTAVSYQNLGEQVEEGLADVEASVFNRDVFQGASRTTLATKDNWSLPRDSSGKVTKILNLDFDNVQARKIREALYEIGTQNARVKFSKLINNPKVVKAIGGEANKDAFVRAVKSSVEAQMRIMPYKPAVQAINNVLNLVSAKGVRIALASLAQPINQIPSVWANASLNLGLPRAIEMWGFPKVSDNLFKYGTILNRKGMRGGYQRQLAPADIEKAKKMSYKILEKMNVPRAMWETVSTSLMGPLIASDFLVAKKSWMAYYKKFREKDQGVKNFDWSAEAENPDPQASAFAEQMVDRSQNVSDYSKQGEAMRRTGTGWDVIKNVMLPFSGFAVNQRGRIYNDLSKIKANPTNTEAYKSLGGTMAEIAAFNAVKLYVMYSITSYLGDLLASGLGFTGDDDEEKKDPEKLTKLGAKSVKDLLFSGMGSLVEHYGTKVVNSAYKELAGSDKDIIPIYTDPNDALDWQQFGLYGTTMEAADEFARDFAGWWTGKTPAVVKGGPKFVEGEGELTDRERNAMGVFAMYELLKITGISDQVLNSTMRKAKSRVDQQIRKREGTTYETVMGIPGEQYKTSKEPRRTRKKRGVERKRRNRR